ncbi:MAG: hypothetical protein LBD32_00475, partial [Cytophagales bacterium]|nr:hypothetical protein [Cytophagales bacterium]
SFFVNNDFFATGPTVALIAADQSSHVCHIGPYIGWNVLSGTGTFNKLVEFKDESFNIINAKEKPDFNANWLNYNVGIQFGYTRFFDRCYGWNVLDVKGGYNQYANFFVKNKDKNSFNYSGLSVDVLTGIAFNLWEDGLDFEEGNQYGNRFVINANGGVNFNFCSFMIKGEPAFTEKFLDVHFAETSQLLKVIVEPSVEWVLRNGFFARGAINIGYFGPWKAEKNRSHEFYLKENKIEKLPDTFSFAPTIGFGWDFSALIN